MSRFRYHDDESSSTATILGVLAGALAGFAAGVFVAQRFGGVSGIKSRLTERLHLDDAADALRSRYQSRHDVEELDDYEDDELELESYDEELEERVLEAFKNDPVLAERAIDIGSIGEASIELAGWVDTEQEADHAVTIARGVPGVDTVVNRITIGDEERRFDDAARKVRTGDPALTESHWEGGQVGLGRRRQGTSDEADRHATPKVPLENRWLGTDAALRNAADETEGLAERRAKGQRVASPDRTGGSPVAPGGVPKADHVANPVDATDAARTDIQRDTSEGTEGYL